MSPPRPTYPLAVIVERITKHPSTFDQIKEIALRKMIKRLILFLIIIPLQISAHQRISLDNECLARNEALLAKKLLEIYGESKVKEFLDNKMTVFFCLEISIKGYTKILYVRSFVEKDTIFHIPMLPIKNKSVDDIFPNLKRNVVFTPGYFDICYKKETNDKEDIELNRIINEINFRGGKVTIHVSFPDNLLQIEYGTKELSSVEKIKQLKKIIVQYCN